MGPAAGAQASLFELTSAPLYAALTHPQLSDMCWAIMAKCIARKCPRCCDYFGVVVNQEPKKHGEHPITAYCEVCGYQLKGWRLIDGRKRPVLVYGGRMPKMFR